MKNQYDYLNNSNIDLSKYENIPIEKEETDKMAAVAIRPKKLAFRRIGAVAACIGIVAAFTQTSFAKEFIDNIIKNISTGHNNFIQTDTSNTEVEIPTPYVALFFDENGNELKVISEDTVVYDKDGNVVEDLPQYIEKYNCEINETNDEVSINISIFEGDPLDAAEEKGYSIIRSESDLRALDTALDFTPLFPEKLPKGYRFHGASYFAEDGKYLTLYYINDNNEYFVSDQRLITEETAFTYSTNGKIEETTVNGHTAVFSNDKFLNWEVGNVAVSVNGRGFITKEQIFNVAESMK